MKTGKAVVALIGLLALASPPADAQGKAGTSVKKFKFRGGKIETGMLYTYVRSDLNATKTGSVLVYVPDKRRVEILKVTPGQDGAVLLTGEMNWDAFTLRSFELWREGRDGGRRRLATGSFSEDAFTMTVEDPSLYRGAQGAATFSVPLPHVPAHIYSLDFVTLGLAMRHFADPAGSAEIGVLTENLGVGPESPNFIVPAGKVKIAYVEEVDRDGIPCLKYQVTGPALGDQEGLIWLHQEKGYIQDAEIPVPSSPDWPDVKITLRSAEKVSEGDWPIRRSLEISTATGR